VGDGVLWQGAGYVSLMAANHGNTPDQSPAAWAEFAASGAMGATGATGAVGPAGLNGLPGSMGATGPAGSTGATGATGSAGLAYQGSYSSATNYNLGDVVVYGGASYASLVASNHGETPASSPGYWGLLAAQGATGSTGGTGATGAQGVQGVQGPAGPQGTQGVQGATGPQGPAGTQGLTGATGPQGAQGATGPQGVAGQAGAQGVQGVTGATGAAGPAGVAGATGATGATGAAGTNGVNGAPGLTWRGAWSASTNYAVNDGVSVGGTSYISLAAGNVGAAPATSPGSWSVLAAAGSAGATGATGATGLTGAAGATGATGSVGATGATGAAGAAGLNFLGAWNAATNYAVNSGVTYGGSTYIALAVNQNVLPDTNSQVWALMAAAGGTGPAGATGAAATVTVGTVTTLAAGTQATVTNAGTASAAVLNFGIPQGAMGAAGTGSGSGTSSGSYAAMYHPVSYTTTYYAVNSPNASSSENATVLAWVPVGCTASQLNVYSQQSGSITVTLRLGATPTTLTNTALACSPVTNGSCVATGSVTVTSGEFIDFTITSASGTTAGVWTALTCQ
jgi:hypothetical protein